MGSLTLQFALRIGGALTNASGGVVLSSPDGSYGVKRLDTGATVVAADPPVAMANVSPGIYRHTITTPSPGLMYSWYARVSHNGATHHFEQEATDPAGLTLGTAGLERWRVITPPAYRPVTHAEVSDHLRIGGTEGTAFFDLRIDAATQYAEQAMNVALCEQTIAVVFAEGEPMTLPRGPLIAVESVTGVDGATTTDFRLSHVGHQTSLVMGRAIRYPVTVVYRAGYARGNPPVATAEAIPADIRLAILAHVGTLYEARESTSEKPRQAVPHLLEAFYKRRSRHRGIG